MVVCSLTRTSDAWTVRAHHRTGDGTVRNYAPIEAIIVPVQERYGKIDRRLPYVLLYNLWVADRVLPCGASGQDEDVLMPLFDLRPELFRCIMEFV